MKPINMQTFISLILLSFPCFVAPKGSAVYQYSEYQFRQQVMTLDGNFVMFYAPWCKICTDFQPTWDKLAEAINNKDSKFAIAQVNCMENHELCQELRIQGFPSLFYFFKKDFVGVQYNYLRDLPSLIMFLNEVFTNKKLPYDTLTWLDWIYSTRNLITQEDYNSMILFDKRHEIIPKCKK